MIETIVADAAPLLIGAVLTGMGVAVGGVVVKSASKRVRWESPDMDYLKKALEQIGCSQKKTSREIQALFQLQDPQIKALIVLLESYKSGASNGNIDVAITEVKQAQKDFHDFLVGGVG